MSFVSSTISVHRIPPRVRDDREPPLIGTGRRAYIADLDQARSGIFLQAGLDSQMTDLPVGQIEAAALDSLTTLMVRSPRSGRLEP